MTTQLIRACLWRNIPIAYLCRMGRCYGRLVAIERGYRHLAQRQVFLLESDRLLVARTIVSAKLRNSRVILQRQRRRGSSDINLGNIIMLRVSYAFTSRLSNCLKNL